MKRRAFARSVVMAAGALRFPVAILDEPYRKDLARSGDLWMEGWIEDDQGARREIVVQLQRWGATDVRSGPITIDHITDEVRFVAVCVPDLGITWDIPSAPRLMPGDTLELKLTVENSTAWDFARLVRS